MHIVNYQAILKRKNLDALFISHPANVSYISGFKGLDSFLLIIKGKEPLFITDFRYLQQARKEISGFRILSSAKSIIREIAGLIKKYHLKKVGFESAHLSYKDSIFISTKTKQKLIPTEGLIEELRIVKNEVEIGIIKKSAYITKSALKKTLAYMKPGMSELEIAGYIEWQMRKAGAQRIAFPPIVASGENSAMPHAVSTTRKIRKQEPIIIDCGCVFDGYNSDLTRTIFLGRINAQFKSIYNTIEEAQRRAISLIHPGVKICRIDKAARDYIHSKGFERYFKHATGHGVGLKVHEAPVVSMKNFKTLKKGMVLTVEPGIYIPGLGGVRIEDMILVTDKSHRILTR